MLSGSACTHCKINLVDEEQYMQHLQQHSNNNPNVQQQQLVLPTACVICRQTLVSEMEAKIHARFHLHQSESASTCCICLQPCERRDLNVGICGDCLRKQSKTSIARCYECQINFESSLALEAHLATTHRKSFQCIKCQVSIWFSLL